MRSIDAGIPFNGMKYESFSVLIEAFQLFSIVMKPVSYHKVRVTNLKKDIIKKNVYYVIVLLWQMDGHLRLE